MCAWRTHNLTITAYLHWNTEFDRVLESRERNIAERIVIYNDDI